MTSLSGVGCELPERARHDLRKALACLLLLTATGTTAKATAGTVNPDGSTTYVPNEWPLGWPISVTGSPLSGYGLTGGGTLIGGSFDTGSNENFVDTTGIVDTSSNVPKDPSAHGGCASGTPVIAGNPIVFATGNKIETEADFTSSGEMPLTLRRTYNHFWGGVGLFGMHWVTSFDYVLTFGTTAVTPCFPNQHNPGCGIGTNTVIYAWRPNGDTVKFVKNATDGVFYENKPSPVQKIIRQADGTFVLYNDDLGQERYTFEGRVLSVADAAGVGWTYSYIKPASDPSTTIPYVLQTITHTSGRVVRFAYDGGGEISSITDPNGAVFNYSVDWGAFGNAYGRLSSVTKPGSPITKITYLYELGSDTGALTGKSFNGVRYSTFAYDANGYAISTEHSGQDKYTFAYTIGSAGALTVKETNPLGKQTTYTFANGKLTSATGSPSTYCPASMYSEIDYDANGYPQLKSDYNGNSTAYTYNAKGQLLQKIEAYGKPEARTTNYTWDPNLNRLTSWTVPGYKKVELGYTSTNRPAWIRETNLSSVGVANQSRTTTFSYNYYTATGIIASEEVAVPQGGGYNRTTRSYDTLGNLISITNNLNQATKFSGHNGRGQPTRVTAPNGAIVDYTYDAQGRAIKERTYPNGVAADTTYAYDTQTGLFASVTPADGVGTFFEYDVAHRLKRQYHTIDGTAATDANEEQAYTYDLMGDVVKVENTRLNGHYETQCTQYRIVDGMQECVQQQQVWVGTRTTTASAFADYDELGRVRSKRGNNGQNFKYSYDGNGNVLTVTNSTGAVSTYTYDDLDRVVTSADAAGTTHLFYNLGDRISKITDPRGLSTTYSYDGFGQLWTLTSPDTGVSQNQYDATGLLTSSTTANGKVFDYAYDALGRTASISSASQVQAFTYDSCANGIGFLCQVTDPTGSISYTYTTTGQVASQSSTMPANGTSTAGYAYDSSGRLSGLTYPDGVSVGYGYANGNLKTVTITKAGVTSKVVDSIAYQPFGAISGWTYGNGLNRGYNYDTDGRVTGVSVTNASSVLQSLTYAYNANNLITKITNGITAGATQSYTYDAVGRLASLSTGYGDTLNYTFDANGNRTREDWLKNGTTTTTNYTIAPDSNRLTAMSGRYTRSYVYDASGNPSAINSWAFTYDAFNRLNAQTLSGGSSNFVYSVNALGQRVYKNAPGTGQYWFVYAPDGGMIADYKAGGQYWTDYVWANGQLVGAVRGNQIYYVAGDHLGRPELITDAAGTAVWRANNYAFNRSLSLNTFGEFNVGLPGQYYDAESTDWYNGYRDYDDESGRYLQSDPIGLNGGINTYAYAGGNPISRLDPWGLDWYYNQGTGEISHVDGDGVVTSAGFGYAGRGAGLNNPSMQFSSGLGPLPVGLYTIQPLQLNITGSGTRLPNSMRLTPSNGNSMRGRGGFLIHSDNSRRNNSASEGCIVASIDIRKQIGDAVQAGDDLLHVYSPDSIPWPLQDHSPFPGL